MSNGKMKGEYTSGSTTKMTLVQTDALGNLNLVPVTSTGGSIITDATSSMRSEEINPLSSHYVSSTIASVTAQGTQTTSYYIDMAGYRSSVFQLVLTAGAATTFTFDIYGTAQDDGTASSSCAYDPTVLLPQITTSGSWVFDTPTCWKYIKITATIVNAGNDSAWDIFSRRLY